LAGVISLIEKSGRPLLIIAKMSRAGDHATACRAGENQLQGCAIHPPEFGHWRKAMLEDIAITTGGRVISVDLRRQLGKRGIARSRSARQCAFQPRRR